ncbi:MAG: hypothetical protein JWM85_1117 [Acidimicrobiaceae bacterium]|nr:hypothetical protein [Acidimicrobiaceae bacterium]
MADPVVGFRQPPQPPSPSPSPSQATEAVPAGETPPPPPAPARGIRSRLDQFRQLGTGGRHPLGSPEGNSPIPTKSPKSSSKESSRTRRRTLDACATGVRSVTVVLDRLLGTEERDMVATANECYEIGAPVAGYLIDRAEGSEKLAAVVDKIGPLAAVMRAGAYLARAFTGAPGGRVEVEESARRTRSRLAYAEGQRSQGLGAEVGDDPEAHGYRELTTVGEEF